MRGKMADGDGVDGGLSMKDTSLADGDGDCGPPMRRTDAERMREKLADGDGVDGGLSMKDTSLADGDGDCGPSTRRTDAERMRQMQLSIAASSSVFPGFRFSPTDDELINYYLKKKLQGSDNCVDIIPEVDFCRHEPWDLPALSIIRSDNEWFFFSTRGRKYPNGSQSKRATQSGYWKATGKERNVKSGAATIGTKRTLVFHTGRAPKGERTEWIMHEYCMSDTTQESLVVCRLRRNGDFRLNESSRGSSDHRNLSATDNSHSATNEHTNIQMDGFADGDAIKPSSKESTSSYRSHSVEQNDSGSESDQQLIHESPHGSSSPYKECDNDEDDCFADIINDDIVKLDESASHSLTFHGVPTGDCLFYNRDPTKCMQKLPQGTVSSHALSGQGTAVRRIRLRRHKVRPQHGKPPRYLSRNDDHDKNKSGCVIDKMTGNVDTLAKYNFKHLVLIFVALVMLFVAWRGNYLSSCSKQHLISSLEASREQLRYWLHKAADYI